MSRLLSFALVTLLTLTPLAVAAQAREDSVPAPPPQPLDSVAQQPLMGDWTARERLATDGISFVAHFIGESAVNEDGYRGNGWAYAQHVDFGTVFELEKLGVGNGTVRILLSDRVGRGLQIERTGAYIQNQAYYGQGQNFRFDELSYERSFLEKQLSLKGGFYSMGNDFAGLPYTCDFNNNGHCGHPLGLLYGSGWVDSPTGQWGMRIKWTDRSGWYAQTGVYDVNPARKLSQNGFDLGFAGRTGTIAPLEIGYVRGMTAADYSGTYKAGIYYDSSDSTDVANPERKTTSRTGSYVQTAQQIWKPEPGVVQGIAIFGVATRNDSSTGLFRTYYEAGASWRGIIPSRGDDIASLGWVRININPRLRQAQTDAGNPAQTDEQLWELNYGAQVAPWLLLRPGLQYVIRPGAYDNRPDTFVFTVHLQATF